ncbi:MAG TPA: HIT family protein [Actinomycetota bacterium]|nr:HIT family protein [Actinomycetota bacterium]
MSDCTFCDIVSGDGPAEVVFEDELTLAFMDIIPYTDGHTLVIPKRHAADIFELEEPDAGAVWRTTIRLAHAIRAALSPEGLTVRQANGRVADQHIMHFHIHLIPRNQHEKRGSLTKIAEFAERIRGALDR